MFKDSFFSKLNRNNRYIIICCFFVFAVNGLYGMVLGSLLPLISAEYGLNNTVSGSLISAHQVGNLIAGFIAGILPLYLGRKKAIIFLCSFVIMGFAIMILTGNPVLLILGFLFTGISRGSISNFNNTIVNEVSNSSSAALNILHSIFAIGALLAPFVVIISTKIAGDQGWRLTAIIIIVLALISVALFSRMEIASTIKPIKDGPSHYELLKDKYFLVSAGVLFFYLCGEAAINGWLVKYFVDSRIMTIAYAQVLASILWAAILIGRLSCAFLNHKVSKKLMLIVMSIMTVAFYLLLLITRDKTIITIAIIGLGLSMAGVYPTTVSTIGHIIKKNPMAMGILLIIGGSGAILMPIITGALADAFGILAGMSAIIFALIMMVVFVVMNIRYKVVISKD